jgi:hypothetical protein
MSKPVILTFPSGAAPWNAEAKGTAARRLMKDLLFTVRNDIPQRRRHEKAPPIRDAPVRGEWHRGLASPAQVFQSDLNGSQNGLIGSCEYLAFR